MFSISINRTIVLAILSLLAGSSIGCNEPPEIRTYRIAKSKSDLGDIGMKTERPTASPAAAVSVPTRMVVAIAERDDATWFFKLTGPVDAVTQSEEQWNKLFTEITFENGKPKWELPEDWTLGAAKPMRFATLMTNVADKGKAELSISSLGPNQDLLSNVNRWLGQLSKPPIEEGELELSMLKSSSGKLKLFDATGLMNSQPMNRPPRVADAEPEFTFDQLDGWKKGPTNSIVKVRLTKGEDPAAVQISVTQLLAAANEWIPNAQRWANQVEMDADEEAVNGRSIEINVDGISGHKIRLVPEDESRKFGMVGVMIVRGDMAWFFKMIGDRETIVESEKEFDEFLSSFRFK